MEVSDDIKPDKRETVTMNNHNSEKHLIVPTNLEYVSSLIGYIILHFI